MCRDSHGGDGGGRVERHGGRAAVHAGRFAVRQIHGRTRAFGENDEGGASPEVGFELLERFGSEVVRRVARCPNGGRGEPILRERRLHDRCCLRNAADEADHIDERRVIGRNDEALALEPLGVLHFNAHKAERADDRDENAEPAPDDKTRDADANAFIFFRKAEPGRDAEAKEHAARAEKSESNRGAEKAEGLKALGGELRATGRGRHCCAS